MATTEFRSPVRKLMSFFQSSRDKWKEKCQKTKLELKLLKRKYTRLLRRLDYWKQQCKELETQLGELARQLPEKDSNGGLPRC